VKLRPLGLGIAGVLAPHFAAASVDATDPLLGRWIRIANNSDNRPDATLDLRLDSTAIYVYKGGPPQVWKYRREPVKEWLKRQPTGPTAWIEPGVEAITFADPQTGVFQDSGGWVLQLVPQHRVQINPLTQAWCRPGDEVRVRRLLGI